MRLFKKVSNRASPQRPDDNDNGRDSNTSANDKDDREDSELAEKFSGLFTDSPGSAVYVESPMSARDKRLSPPPPGASDTMNLDVRKMDLEEFASPIGRDGNSGEDMGFEEDEVGGPLLQAGVGGSVGDEPQSKPLDFMDAEPRSSANKNYRQNIRRDSTNVKSPKPPVQNDNDNDNENDPCDNFEVAPEEDDTFMIEEATRRDFRNAQTDADVIKTATVLFKNKNKKKENYDMSAEDILRTMRWGRNKKPGGGTPVGPGSSAFSPQKTASPAAKRRPPPLAQQVLMPKTPPRRSSKGKRPPPLVAKLQLPDSPAPTSQHHSNIFNNEGGFRSGGFNITLDGIVLKPEIEVREDELKTLRFDQIRTTSMNSLCEFKKGPTIGAGAAGRVYIALHTPSSLAVAMKTVNVYDEPLRKQLMKELVTLSRHVSIYLVRFYGAFYDGKGAVHIALEFMDRGCLNSLVTKSGPIPEHVVRVIAVDCIRGLRFLHKYKVLHRDFKTANILISREQCCAKISDFGLAKDVSTDAAGVHTVVGTVAYLSPERLKGEEYGYASDIWALGVCLAECFMGKYPFDKPSTYFDYLDANLSQKQIGHESKEFQSVSKNAQDFVRLTTDADPNVRPSAAELLQHPWLKDFVPSKQDRINFGEWIDMSATKDAPKSR